MNRRHAPALLLLLSALLAALLAGGCPSASVDATGTVGDGGARDVPGLPDGAASDGAGPDAAASDGAAPDTALDTAPDTALDTASAAHDVAPSDSAVDAPRDVAPPQDGGGPPAPCDTHSACRCPGGVCLSTGACWCPPCESDDDCPPGEVCRAGGCAVLPPECVGPLRLVPSQGPETGGTLVTVEGQEFWVGALEWWAIVGDTWLRPLGYGGCGLAFLSPPLPPGEYPVHVLYGYPPGDGAPPDEADPVGTFTVLPWDGLVGRSAGCRSDLQCSRAHERCDLGSGRCVPDLCASLLCPGDACDPVEGCVSEAERCTDDADCRLLESGCVCDAVPADDPRETLADCRLDGCAECAGSWCDHEPLEAACVAGVCTERRRAADGVRCAAVDWEDLGRAAGGARGPVAAATAGGAGLAWTDPVVDPAWRYGVVRLLTLGRGAEVLSAPVPVGEAGQRASNAALAAFDGPGGAGYQLAWLDEAGAPVLRHRRFDGSLVPLGEETTLVDDLPGPVQPFLLPRADGGADLLWAQRQWSARDGLYRLPLDGAGTPEADAERWPWIVPTGEDWAAARAGSRAVVAWRSDTFDDGGLFAAVLPLADIPVQRLSEGGHSVSVAATPRETVVVWVEDRGPGTTTQQALLVQALDPEGRPLHPPRELRRGPGAVYAPRAAFLGGWAVVTWLERERFGEGEPYRLRAAVLGDDLRPQGAIRELGETVTDIPAVAQVRSPAADGGDSAAPADVVVLTGWAEGRGLHWGRWTCGGGR